MSIVFVLEIIGTVAFAYSGAMVAIEKKMDILGVIALGMTTAVGGGITRDLVLGILPPTAFIKPVYALSAIGTSLLIFPVAIRKLLGRKPQLEETVLLLMDSVGLGVFTVVGANKAYEVMSHPTLFLVVFVGILTGVGGGVLRDLFAGNRPYIFVKHFYASASILGAVAFGLLNKVISSELAMIAGGTLVVVLRMLAARYRWSLPKAKPTK